jgi:hypothetical protein
MRGMGERHGACLRLIRAAAALGAAVAVAGCSSHPEVGSQPLLYSPVNGSFGSGLAGLTPGSHISQGDIPLCVSEPATVTITGVEPITSTNGMTVSNFAVRTIPTGSAPLGVAIGDLGSLGMTKTEQEVHQVSVVCNTLERSNVGIEPASDPSVHPRIDLVVTMSADGLPASIKRLRILYTVNGVAATTESRVAFAMCGGKTTDVCTPPDQ